jgi:hypothetical protein
MAPMRALRTTDGRFLLAILAVVVVGLLPATATAQTPGVGGYAGVAPTAVDQTAPPGDGDAGIQGAQEDVTPAQGVNPAVTQGTQGAQGGAGAAPSGTLPFTGLQIGLMLFGGLALLGMGLTLRRTAARPLA